MAISAALNNYLTQKGVKYFRYVKSYKAMKLYDENLALVAIIDYNGLHNFKF